MRERFEAAVVQAMPQMRQLAYRYVGNVHDAEDVVQDALLSAYKNLERFEGRSGLRTWLHKIVVNAALMRLRPRICSSVFVGDLDSLQGAHATPEQLAHEKQVSARIDGLIQNLSPLIRQTILLRCDGLTILEISAALGIPEGTVKARLSRGRQILQTRWRGMAHA